MTCQSFHQVEIECDHKYRTYIQIPTPDACMKVVGDTYRTSVLSDSTISEIFVLLDSTKNRYRRGNCWRHNREQKIVLCHRGLFFVLYFVADSTRVGTRLTRVSIRILILGEKRTKNA